MSQPTDPAGPPGPSDSSAPELHRHGTVSHSDSDTLAIVLDPMVRCGGCTRAQSCGAGLLGMLVPASDARIHLPARAATGSACTDGERVTLSIAASLALRMAFAAYCLPVLSMMIFAMICQYYVSSEADFIAASGFAGLIVGLIGGLIAYPGVPGDDSTGPGGVLRVSRIESTLRKRALK